MVPRNAIAMLVKLLMGLLYVTVIHVNQGESSYQDPARRMALMKASLHTLRAVAVSRSQESSSRVHHVTAYGADPTGISDSTEALQQAISDAFRSGIEGAHLMEGIADIGGAQLHLDGGTYKISRPLRLPDTGAGNFMVHLTTYYISRLIKLTVP